MPHSAIARFPQAFVGLSKGAQGAILLILSALFYALFKVAHLPASLMLGPMGAAIAVAGLGAKLAVPTPLFAMSQGLVGCLIARGIEPDILGEIAGNWPLFIALVLAVIAVSCALGWILMRSGVLPNSTALWGSAPGGATAMILMSEPYGADVRLVAFMQFLRVVMVALVASVVARILSVPLDGAAPAAVLWFPVIHWPAFLETLALAACASMLGARLRVPGGSFLFPLFIGVILQDTGLMTIELPPWLLAIGYATIGWSIGLRFTHAILAHAARSFPRVVASTLMLIAICGLFALVLVRTMGLDPLTAYLATSPGGVDSVAIIAASSKVDVPFVMAMQTARFMIVLFIGPKLMGFLSRKAAG
jgi:membrane AbrB-like protein